MKFVRYGLLLVLILFVAYTLQGCKMTEKNQGEDTNAEIITESIEESTETTSIQAEPETEEPKDNTVHRPTAEDIVNDIILGWNLGNSLDSYSDEILGLKSETCWGNPVITKELIDMVKEAGFNAVRVPVTWYNHMDEANQIDEAWMDRVEEVVNYVLDNDMYCIINVHHDTGEKGWLKASSKDLDEKKEKFQAIWEQVADRFGDYKDKLLFESFNEILDEECNWVHPKEEALDITNELNQIFVDTVRSSGKSNDTRCLIVNTYCAGANKDIVKGFVLPTDTISNKLIVEAHIYQPFYFTSETSPETTTWAPGKPTLESYLKNMHTNFVEKGIPVIIGEFGAVDKNNRNDRQAWLRFYVDTCTDYNIKCFWWDNGKEYKIFNRRTLKVSEPELIDIMLTEAKGGTYEFDWTVYGDADGDGSVNERDLDVLLTYLNGETFKVENCDINKDGTIDEKDAELLSKILKEKNNLCGNLDNWSNWVNFDNGADAQMNYTENGGQIAVSKPGRNTWDVQLAYTRLTFEQGQSYKISFDYSGSPAQTMPFNIIQDYGDYKAYFSGTLDYKEESQHYEGVFHMTEKTDNQAKITFDCGASKLGIPYAVTIENLTITKLP